MTITIAVTAKGVTWSRTATLEVDAAIYRNGKSAGQFFGTEGSTSQLGLHSYSGLAAALFANKAKGATALLQFNGSDYGVYLPTWMPFVAYAGATAFIGHSASATDLPDTDLTYAVNSSMHGAIDMQALAGLKPIS